MYTRRSLAVRLLVLSSIGAVVGQGKARARGQVLRVNLIPAAEVAPIYAAVKMGYFAAEGLEVDTTPSVGGAAGIPGLIGGAYDIIYGNVVSNLLARAQGLDVKVISAASNGGFGSIMARKDSGVKRGADLHGKALAVNTRNNVIWLYARAWVKATGGDPSKVTFKEVPFPQMTDALVRRQTDAAFMIEPFLTAAASEDSLTEIGKPYAELQPEVQVGQYGTTDKLLKAHPDVIERFLHGQEKGNQWVKDHIGKAELAELITSYTKIPLEITKRLPIAQPTTELKVAEIKKTMVLMKENGLLKADVDLSTVLYKTNA